jgi:hypothetical protein
MKTNYFLWIVCLFLLSCRTGSNQDDRNQEKITIEKTDSVEIQLNQSFRIHDLSPEQNRIALVSEDSLVNIVFAEIDGSTVSRFSIRKEEPGGFGLLMAPIRFLGKDSVIVYSAGGFSTYGISGAIKSQLTSLKPVFVNRAEPANRTGLEKSADRYLHLYEKSMRNRTLVQDLDQQTKHLVWLDIKTGKREPFLEFPEKSLFRNGKHFFSDAWKPAFTLEGGLIYVVFGIEPTVYVFDATEPYALTSSTPLNLIGYQYYKGSEIKSTALDLFDWPQYSGKILKIHRYHDSLLIVYFPGITPEDTQRLLESNSTIESFNFSREIKRKYPPRLAIVDSLGKASEASVPSGLDIESILVKDGTIWMQEKPDTQVNKNSVRLFKVHPKYK